MRRRFAPHQPRHAHAVEMAGEGVPLIVIQRQFGHTNLGITSITSRASTTCSRGSPGPRAKHGGGLTPRSRLKVLQGFWR